MHEVWYVNGTMSDDDVLAYYRNGLTSQGYTVDPVSHSSGGDQRIDFTRPSLLNGYVATVGGTDSMSRRFKNVIKIAYHPLTH